MPNLLNQKKQKIRLIRFRLGYLFLLLSIFTPFIFYLGLGVNAWLDLDNKWLILLLLTLLSTVSGLTYKYFFSLGHAATPDISVDFEPTNKKSWGAQEEKIWQDAKAEAVRMIDLAPNLTDVLHHHPLALADFVADQYGNKSKLDINAVEALILIEEVSKRYRLILQKRFPFIEEITLKRVDQVYRAANSKLFKGAIKYAPWTLKAYQFFSNPAGKAFESVFGDVKGELVEESINTLQLRLKQIFLFECVEVLMDLYSGRFLIANDTLVRSTEYYSDSDSLEQGLEPLRIVVIGQISSGKSTLVNHLCGEILAEVDMLPTTDKRTVYEIHLPSGLEIRLCDLPGLDNDEVVFDNLFKEVITSDLVIWCFKATQSAKFLDQMLSQRLDEYFSDVKNVSVKPPKILGVLTHVDLLKERALEKGLAFDDVLRQTSEYNSDIVSLDAMVSLQKHDEALKQIQSLIENYLEESLQVQLNRRRKASINRGAAQQFQRLIKGSSALANLFK